MKNMIMTGATLALVLTVSLAQAQSGTVAKKAATTEAKAQVAADKADMKMNREARKADRKAMVKKEGKLMKDQANKDAKAVKEKL